MSIALQNRVDELEKRIEALEKRQPSPVIDAQPLLQTTDVPGRTKLTLPEKRKSA